MQYGSRQKHMHRPKSEADVNTFIPHSLKGILNSSACGTAFIEERDTIKPGTIIT